jgi:zinc resistance-associated protein
MNSFHFRIVSFILAAMLGLSGLAMAAGPYARGNTTDQNLDKQQELARTLHEDFYKNTGATRQELIARSRDLEAQMYGPNPDEKKIQALAKEVSDLRAQLYIAHITLQSRLIREGVMPGYGGTGPGMRGYGPGMHRGAASCCGAYAPDMGRAASCCDGAFTGMGRGYGPGMGYGPGRGRGYGPGMRGCW